jgi:hypothetical protein
MANIIGTLGVALLLAAFLLNLLKRLPADGAPYNALNVLGAGLACYSSYLIDFLPFVVLEGVWTIAAAVALARSFSPRSG